MNSIALIPLLPLASAVILMASTGRMPRQWAAIFGAGSVGFSALCVAMVAMTVTRDDAPVLRSESVALAMEPRLDATTS